VADGFDLLSVLTAARSPLHTTGWRHGEALRHETFLGRVRAWRALLGAGCGRAYALYLNDPLEFAAALLGAWQANKTIYLPGDNLPGTCAALRGSVQGYLGEFDAGYKPQAPAQDGTEDDGAFRRLDPDFPGLVLHTSGTTGAPQAIPKKLAQLAAEVAVLEKQFGPMLENADIVSTVSHQHIYGLLFKVLWPLAGGRAIHAAGYSFFEALTGALAERDCALISSPAHLKRLQEDTISAPAINRLRAVFSSGGPLPLDVARECKRLLGHTPIEVYGSSETGGIAWRQQTTPSDEAWTPFPDVQWRIDPACQVLEVASPYLPSVDWFRTADRAAEAGHGFILKGRVDRIAKIEGKRISLSAIESLLASSPLVTAARVIVLDGARQRVAAFVVLSANGRQRLAESGRLQFNRSLRNLLVGSIEAVGLPRIWRYPNALPVNAQGKTTVAGLRALVERESAKPTQPRKRLVEQNSHLAIFELTAPCNLLYFDGHFSGRPILPGVVQLDWVIGCARQCFKLPPRFRGVHALKFQRVIPPETPVRLELAHDDEKGSLSLRRARARRGERLFRASAGRLRVEYRG
jgi:acyl-CoA synthetase (AMP-forming)/AMP-acid ligase II